MAITDKDAEKIADKMLEKFHDTENGGCRMFDAETVAGIGDATEKSVE